MKNFRVLILFSIALLIGVSASAVGVDEVAKWTGLAITEFRKQPRASQAVGVKVVLSSMGANVSFVLTDHSTVNFMCHNMGGQDMCM